MKKHDDRADEKIVACMF